MSSPVPTIITEFIEAVNAHDTERILAAFEDGALVNDAQREFWGADQIRPWVAREIVEARVTMEPVQTVVHHGLVLVRARYDGDYDKTNLPPELVLTNYFTVHAGRIDTLIIVHNQSNNAIAHVENRP